MVEQTEKDNIVEKYKEYLKIFVGEDNNLYNKLVDGLEKILSSEDLDLEDIKKEELLSKEIDYSAIHKKGRELGIPGAYGKLFAFCRGHGIKTYGDLVKHINDKFDGNLDEIRWFPRIGKATIKVMKAHLDTLYVPIFERCFYK